MYRAAAIFASLLLHWLILQPLMLGSHAAKRPPREESGPGANVSSADDTNYMTLIMVSMPSASELSATENVASSAVAESDLFIQIASQDPAPLLEPEQFESESEVSEAAARTAGDPALQSLLFGRYAAQIDSRVQRAWRKPRSPVNEQRSSDTFECHARISQDAVGNVTEIELMQCEGTTEWQMSLVRAIQRASPLPAPPSPTVFTNALTLTFEGRAYGPGSREDEYEPRSAEVARVSLAH